MKLLGRYLCPENQNKTLIYVTAYLKVCLTIFNYLTGLLPILTTDKAGCHFSKISKENQIQFKSNQIKQVYCTEPCHRHTINLFDTDVKRKTQ